MLRSKLRAPAVIKDGVTIERPVCMKQGIEYAVEGMVAQLKTMSVPVQDNQQIDRVASVAANSDERVGKHVTEPTKKSARRAL